MFNGEYTTIRNELLIFDLKIGDKFEYNGRKYLVSDKIIEFNQVKEFSYQYVIHKIFLIYREEIKDIEVS